MIPALICMVASVTDGDTFRCADATRIRIAAIEANELHGGCHLSRCAPMSARRAKAYLAGLIAGNNLTCRPVDISYSRVVATCRLPDGRDLGCTMVRAGAALWWESYARRYGLGRCAK